MIKTQNQNIWFSVVIAAAMLTACGRVDRSDTATVSNPEVAVVTLKARRVTLSQDLPGHTSAFLVAEVRPQVSGIIKSQLFREGGYVKAGQGLYDLEDTLYRAQYDSAEAGSRKAHAAWAAAQLAAKRSRELFDDKIVSAQNNENVAAAEAQAQADAAAADADVAVNRVNLAHAHIVAPLSGRIGKSSVTQGALVTADQAVSLATIQQIDPIYVEVNQSSREWLSLKQAIDAGRVQTHGAGATAKIVLENGSMHGYDGKLQFADATVDPGTGNLLIRILVPNPNLQLLPGMYVRAVLDEGVLPDGLLVPQQAITRDPKGNASACVVDKEGKVELRAVRLSRLIDNQWLVESGLTSGDRVIVDSSLKVVPGVRVQAVEQAVTRAESAQSQPLAAPNRLVAQ